MSFKNLYIILIRIFKIILFIKLFDQFSSFKKSFLRSLFSIYNLQEMVTNDIIWINIKSKKYIERFLKKNHHVLEYGSGSSSFFFWKKS